MQHDPPQRTYARLASSIPIAIADDAWSASPLADRRQRHANAGRRANLRRRELPPGGQNSMIYAARGVAVVAPMATVGWDAGAGEQPWRA